MDISQIFNAVLPSFSDAAVIVFVCSMILYFIIEYKTKSDNSDFSFGFWLKDNWYNMVVSIILFVMYNYTGDYVSAKTLFLIAFGSNYMVDALVTYRYKKMNR